MICNVTVSSVDTYRVTFGHANDHKTTGAYIVMEDNNVPNDANQNTNEMSNNNDLNFTRNEGVHSNVVSVKNNGICPFERSRKIFSKRDQRKPDIVRCLHHVAVFPSNETLACSVVLNVIKNSHITNKDAELFWDVLVSSEYDDQDKTIRG